MLDNKKYFFEINSSNASEILNIEVLEQVYETNLTINKFYFKYGIPLNEEEAKFEIYFKNKLFDTLITDKNGEALLPCHMENILLSKLKL